MNEWWVALTALQKGLFYIAIPSSTFMLAQLTMTLIGLGGPEGGAEGELEDGGDAHEAPLELSDGSSAEAHDIDISDNEPGDMHDLTTIHSEQHDMVHHPGTQDHSLSEHESLIGFKMLTIRSIVALLVGFSWTSLALLEWNTPGVLALAGGGAVGFGLMVLVAAIMSWISRLKESGNVSLQKAIGQLGSVYIPIPGGKSGSGKIQMVIQGRLRELDAVTYDEDKLPTGTDVIIVAVERETSTVVVTRDKP